MKNGAEKKVITLGSGVGDYNMTLEAEDEIGGPYCISKAAVVMVVAKYAAKYKKDGFVFLTISPGLVNTSNKERKWFTEHETMDISLIRIFHSDRSRPKGLW